MPSSLWDANGVYRPAGRHTKTFDWAPVTAGELLPSWLVATATAGTPATGTPTGAATAGNTGNATIGTFATSATAQVGTYSAECATATTFIVRDPRGIAIGRGVFGTPFTTQVTFTITAGGTPCVAGDSFTIVVPQGVVQTLSGADTSRGIVQAVTSTTSGHFAGVKTAFNLQSDQFEEIGIFVYSWGSTSNSATLQNMSIQYASGANSQGMFLQNNPGAATPGATQLRVYTPVAQTMSWELVLNSNGNRRKDVGVIIRPRTREVYVTCGDPAEGAGVVWYDAGNWVDVTNASAEAVQVRIFTQEAATKTMQFSRIKLRLSAN